MTRDQFEIPTIERAELEQAISRGDLVLVEALSPPFFADAHLPGAVNIPCHQVAELAPVLLPNRRGRVVVYGGNAESTTPRIAARRLFGLGYRRVEIYPGGKQDWVEALLPVERG